MPLVISIFTIFCWLLTIQLRVLRLTSLHTVRRRLGNNADFDGVVRDSQLASIAENLPVGYCTSLLSILKIWNLGSGA